MHRIAAVALFVFSLSIIGQALAINCVTLAPGGQACCIRDNKVQVYPILLAEGYVFGPPGLGGIGYYPDGSTQYMAASAASCHGDSLLFHNYTQFNVGCGDVRYTSFGQVVSVPVRDLVDNSLSQHWTITTYGKTKPYINDPSRVVPCFVSTGRAIWREAPPPPLVICPIYDLLPKPTDACSKTLERTFGKIPAGDTTCPKVAVMEDPLGEPCFKRKAQAQGVVYTEPTSTYRTAGYQNHIADVWDKWNRHSVPMNLDVYQSCTVKRAVVLAEMDGPPAPGHKLVYPPSGNSHSGAAFDVDSTVVSLLRYAVPDLQAYLNTAAPGDAACNLTWGGKYDYPDNVHFVTK